MRGEITQDIQYAIAALSIFVLVLVAVLFSLDPLESPEARALEIAQITASDINAFSSLFGLDSKAIITRDKPFDIAIVHRNPFGDSEGHYLAVSTYKEGEAISPEYAYLVSYPQDEDPLLLFSARNVTKICVTKSALEKLAEVSAC